MVGWVFAHYGVQSLVPLVAGFAVSGRQGGHMKAICGGAWNRYSNSERNRAMVAFASSNSRMALGDS